MFSDCPPQPIYSQTWDVSCVTKYLLTLGNSRYLSLKQLLWKLAMSFALTFPERVYALTKLDLRYCPVLPEGIRSAIPSSKVDPLFISNVSLHSSLLRELASTLESTLIFSKHTLCVERRSLQRLIQMCHYQIF
ncbi:unnamed protein product [Porites lobata]|uniref:Uncharacterized protein n=1 Tax=Porites lobata TaxID=104759 RepID=A0ABN8NX11_9CNID|nr:unnamed protein product [Porites lobata]